MRLFTTYFALTAISTAVNPPRAAKVARSDVRIAFVAVTAPAVATALAVTALFAADVAPLGEASFADARATDTVHSTQCCTTLAAFTCTTLTSNTPSTTALTRTTRSTTASTSIGASISFAAGNINAAALGYSSTRRWWRLSFYFYVCQ